MSLPEPHRMKMELTKELLVRISDKQFNINQSKQFIENLVKTRYCPEYTNMRELIGKVAGFTKNCIPEINYDEENKFTYDEKLHNTDILKELEKCKLVEEYTEFIPEPEVLSPKINKRYRRLIAPENN